MNDKLNEAAAGNSNALNEMERLRKKTKMIRRVKWLWFALYPFLWFGPDMLGVDLTGPLSNVGIATAYGILIIAGPFVGFFLFHKWSLSLAKKYHNYSDIFKTEIVTTELNKALQGSAFQNAAYEAKGGWPEDDIRRLGLFRGFNAYDSNDMIRGKYKGMDFAQADINLYDEHREGYTDSEGKSRTRTVRSRIFCGRMIKFMFDKWFPAELRIASRGIAGIAYNDYTYVSAGGGDRVTSASMNGYEKIETELVDFNDDFFVFTKDPLAALTILKPQTTIKIFGAFKESGMDMAWYFRGRELLIFQATGGATFELSTNMTLEALTREVKAEIEDICRFLDIMVDIADDFASSSVMLESEPGESRSFEDVSARTSAAVTRIQGPAILKPQDADLYKAPNVCLEGEVCNLGGWRSSNIVEFQIYVEKPCRYTIAIDFSKNKRDSASCDLKVAVGDCLLVAPLAATGSDWSNYVEQVLGDLELPAGATTLSLFATNMKGDYVMNLRSVRLAPVE